jgi:predicted alpha/beta-fold hydrolase
MALPYWSKRANLRTVEDFWAAGDLQILMKNLPATVHVVLSADDPLNESAELKELRANVDAARLTVLPHGGHLGYGRTDWAKARAARLFE